MPGIICDRLHGVKAPDSEAHNISCVKKSDYMALLKYEYYTRKDENYKEETQRVNDGWILGGKN